MNYLTTGLKIAHHGHVTDILDNGHTIQVTVEPGSMLVTPQGSYELKQFHFHSPSEHTVEGKSFPMEAHFVHQSAQGDFAVVAVLFSEGPTNENLATLITHFPPRLGDSYVRPDVKLDLRLHVPAASHAPALYTGSFTTPPCTEPVAWLVFRTPFYASAEQLAAFADKLQHNNRPIQALHERRVDSGSLAGAPQSSAP
jgi:carbonic anhydrase